MARALKEGFIMKEDFKGANTLSSAPDAETPSAIVGIGASAGGLEAIEAFFKAMSVNSGMGFVVIQHLAPDYKSMMVELLSRKTDIPVQRAEDGMRVCANNVYMIPPRKNLTIFHGKLLLSDHTHREGINLPVDIFFKSLAEDQKEKSVGVILSGSGSDGARGVRAIKELGGLVLVQDEDSAKFDGMPKAAASTGLADYILPPEKMPSELLACLNHPYASRRELQNKLTDKESSLTRLFYLLRAKTKVDFTYYKPSTTTRRIERRIAVARVPDLDAYVHYLEQNPEEIVALYRELLIGVTSFFRDHNVVEILEKKVFPQLYENSRNQELRLWVAGCSTGEEAYTLAIIARKVMEETGLVRDVKIFATDIDKDAVARAGTGVYPESIAADLRPALLAKYFYCRGDTYQVVRSIREMVVFAQHNLVTDPPFTKIDLVSCRNLLIYLQVNLQRRALEMFDFSLRPGGFLVLGNSESVGDFENRFETYDQKTRVYRSLGKSGVHLRGDALNHDSSKSLPGVFSTAMSPAVGKRSHRAGPDRLVIRLLEVLSKDYVPLAVVVNGQMEIVYSMGDFKGLFFLPPGRAVFDISKMVSRELSIALSTGIQKSLRTGEEIFYSNVRIRDEIPQRNFRLRMRPLPGRKNEETLVVVFFEDIERIEDQDQHQEESVAYNLSEEASQRLQDLEQELQFSRENLQATIEELETSNEELQATNEELLASNEELQSTNQELQSTNEELYTVNTEYQNKILELTEAQNDVENLLSSSRIGTLILDEDLCIRKYSPQAAEVFNLVDGDVGRPLKHLAHNLVDFDPVALARKVQKNEKTFELDVRDEGHNWHLVRVLPYHVGPKTFSGIVITLVDITNLRDARDLLQASRQQTDDIFNHMPSGLLIYEILESGELVLEKANQAADRITGMDLKHFIGGGFLDFWPRKQGRKLQKELFESAQKNEEFYSPKVFFEDQKFQGVFDIRGFCLPNNRLVVCFDKAIERTTT
jgi:two-component system CheB/CheR fusion protein